MRVRIDMLIPPALIGPPMHSPTCVIHIAILQDMNWLLLCVETTHIDTQAHRHTGTQAQTPHTQQVHRHTEEALALALAFALALTLASLSLLLSFSLSFLCSLVRTLYPIQLL